MWSGSPARCRWCRSAPARRRCRGLRRRCPGTGTVNTDLDADAADGFCSLREAIVAANDDAAHNECPAGDGPDRIVFNLTLLAEINLTADLPPISDTLLLRGPGPLQLVIDGADLHRLLFFDVPLGGGWLGVERLTLYRGRSPGGPEGDGGGAYLGAGETAWFRRVGFVENRSANSGGGLAIGSAGSSPTSATVLTVMVAACAVPAKRMGMPTAAASRVGTSGRVIRDMMILLSPYRVVRPGGWDMRGAASSSPLPPAWPRTRAPYRGGRERLPLVEAPMDAPGSLG